MTAVDAEDAFRFVLERLEDAVKDAALAQDRLARIRAIVRSAKDTSGRGYNVDFAGVVDRIAVEVP